MAVKQTIPTNSNPPKTMVFSKFRGVDLSSSPFEVSTSRATHSLNMINENGVNHKRKGRMIMHNSNPFGSYMQLIKLKDGSGLNTYKLIVNNTTLSVAPRDSGATSASVTIGNCDNRWCKAYEQNGCAYFLSEGIFKKIYVDNNQVHIDDITDGAYVPTTMTSINSEYGERYMNATSSLFEDANLLTAKRKNSLIVTDYGNQQYEVVVEVISLFDNASSLEYQFVDADTNKIISIDALGKQYVSASLMTDNTYNFKIICDGNELTSLAINNFKFSAGDENFIVTYNNVKYGYFKQAKFNGSITIDGITVTYPTIHFYNNIVLSNTTIWNYLSGDYIPGDMYLTDSTGTPIVYMGNKTYTLEEDIKPATYVKFEIKTKYDVSSQSYGYDVITYNATIGYPGSSTYTPIKVSYGGSNYVIGYFRKNKIYINSEIKTYSEGADNIVVEYIADIDDTTTAILDNKYSMNWAMDGNSDRLFAYGNEEAPALLYFSGFRNFEYFPFTNSVLVGNTSNPITGISILSDSTIAVHKAKRYKEANIFYLTPTTVTINNEDRVTLKAESGTFGETPINPNCCVLFGDDHLIISENGVFAIMPGANIKIGERYAYERSSLIHDSLVSDLSTASYDLEYVTGNVSAIEFENKLYIAVNGKIYVSDLRYRSGARDQDMNDTYNYEWWIWNDMPTNIRRFVTYSYDMNGVETKETLYFFAENNEVGKFIKEDKFKDEDWYYYSSTKWSADNNDLINLDENLYSQISSGDYIHVTIDDTSYQYEVEKVSGGYVKLKDDRGNYVDPDDNDICNIDFYLIKYSNVVSEWYTPIINMGTPLYSKNLLSTTLTFEPDTEGTIKFGYLTRRNAAKGIPYKQSDTLSVNGVDFTDIDFTDFSFATNFAGARTLKTRVRNFNYIQFRIKSEDDKDCALNNFVVTYNIGRKNKGVR